VDEADVPRHQLGKRASDRLAANSCTSVMSSPVITYTWPQNREPDNVFFGFNAKAPPFHEPPELPSGFGLRQSSGAFGTPAR
jgi:hypothetical protein